MPTRTFQFEAMDVEDTPCSKASNSNAFTSLHFGEPIDTRFQVLPGDTLQFSPSSHPDDSLTHRCDGIVFPEYNLGNARCIDFTQDRGSWSPMSTPGLISSGLSNLRTLDEMASPCTPNTFDGVDGPTISPNASLPDLFDALEDPPLHYQNALYSSYSLPSSARQPSSNLLPSPIMSPACSQVSLDPASTTSLLFSSPDNPETGDYVLNNIGDGYGAPQPVTAPFDSSSYGPQSPHHYGWDVPPHSAPPSYGMAQLPPEALIYHFPHPHHAFAPFSGWNSAPPGTVALPPDEVEATEVASIGDYLPSIASLGTTGQPQYPSMRRRRVSTLNIPTSYRGYLGNAPTSAMVQGQRRKADPSIDSRVRGFSVVSATSHIGDAGTSTMGDRQTYNADPNTDCRFHALPQSPLTRSMGDLGRQQSKKTSQTARKGAPSKKTSRTAREHLSCQSSSTTGSPLTTSSSWGSPASSLEGGESESVHQPSPPIFPQIGSSGVSVASQLRRKHPGKYKCELESCGATFTTRHNYNHHMNRHMGVEHYCSKCGAALAHQTSKDRHEKKCKRQKPDA